MPEVESKPRFKRGQRAWAHVEGHFKRELVQIESKFLGDDNRIYYRVSYIIGTQAGGTYLQGVIVEEELGVHYG